jgi:hypothetical protein
MSVLGLLLPVVPGHAQSYRPFMAEQYSPSDFRISEAEFRHGNAVIRITQVKRTSEKHDELPYVCRAWLDVAKSKETVLRRYFDDIDAVGGSYGLFVPEVQPSSAFFAVIKEGDYNGRLFLVRKDGKVFDLLGGPYFISKDKRYLFSQYASDNSGLVVFDLRKGVVVFSSDNLPEYQHHWYVLKDSYFFTASDWPDTSGMPRERKGVAFFFDFKSRKIVKKSMTSQEMAASHPVAYDFDPRKCQDCTVAPKSEDRK